jgi:hypothetical protein
MQNMTTTPLLPLPPNYSFALLSCWQGNWNTNCLSSTIE